MTRPTPAPAAVLSMTIFGGLCEERECETGMSLGVQRCANAGQIYEIRARFNLNISLTGVVWLDNV